MTPKTLHIDVVSAERSIFSGEAAMVNVSGEMGELGIAPGHSQLFTLLRPGNVRLLLSEGGEEVFYVSGGLLEVQPHAVTVLADTALRADELDEAAALQAKAAAEKALSEKSAELDFARASAELAESIAQLRTLQKIRKHMK